MSDTVGERDAGTGRFTRRGNGVEGADGGTGAIDPAAAAAAAGTPAEPGERPKRRTRNGAGSGTGTGKRTRKTGEAAGASLDLSSFVGIWAGLHCTIATLTDNPEIAISEDDAREWLLRCQNVMRHYPIGASQKAVDWGAFTMVTAFMYLPRFAAIAKRRAETPRPPPQQAMPGATVFHMGGAPQGPRNGSGHPFPTPPPVPPTVDGEIAEPPMDMPTC